MNAATHHGTAALSVGAVLHSPDVEHGEAIAWPLAALTARSLPLVAR